MRKVRRGSHCVFDTRVHLVWITKYRYKVLTGRIAQRIRELVRQVCESRDVQILRGHVSADHIHLYLSFPPQLSISELVKALKGRSSRKIQQEFPELCRRYWGKHFWAIGYAAFTSGEVTDKTIQEYISNHGCGEDSAFTID